MLMVLGGYRGDLPPRRAVLLHVQLRVEGIGVHERTAKRFIDPRLRRGLHILDERRIAAQELRDLREIAWLRERCLPAGAILGVELLGPDRERDLRCASCDLPDREIESGAAS